MLSEKALFSLVKQPSIASYKRVLSLFKDRRGVGR